MSDSPVYVSESATQTNDVDRPAAVQWVSRAIERGLSRVYAVEIGDGRPTDAHDSSLERTLQPIDEVLTQAKALGRRGIVIHLDGARFGGFVIVLSDCAPDAEWLMPAVQKRLHDVLADRAAELALAETPLLDLACGDRLQFLGYELRATACPNGRLKVHAQCLGPTVPQPAAFLPHIRFPFGGLKRMLGHLRFSGIRLPRPRLTWSEWIGGLCAFGLLLVSLYFALPPMNRLSAASDQGVQGFYRGIYWTQREERVQYGLYVPPTFRDQPGPFPLIVFLHGYGLNMETIFDFGPPKAIKFYFGENKKLGRFDFVAFFPIDPTGNWKTGTNEMDGALEALEYVIEKQRIDRSRIYLTGASNGADGVWRLAEAFPDKWAAVAPVSSFVAPDVQKVRHIPAWIVHSAKDQFADVKTDRDLVAALKKAHADIHYVEVPDQNHNCWPALYCNKGVYEWFATKSRK
jgi:predicted esterase